MRVLFLSILLSATSVMAQPSHIKEEPPTFEVREELSAFLSSETLISEGWSELAQPIFWKQVIGLSPDSCIVNIAKTRTIIAKMSLKDWDLQSDDEKTVFRDSVRTAYGLLSTDKIYVTSGKNDFYRFDDVYPSLAKGVDAFEQNCVDPWYAQAILLIESPGQLKKSRVGAYGPFQLMPAVARAQGLKVNRSVDERKDFYRSAYGASQLIKRICIPEAKKILNAKKISYNETDTWFRLFVLHVYHAGAMNVAAVVNKINPTEGGQQLIQAMWQNKAAQFGNNSQNYSQLALASQLIAFEK